MPNKIEPLSLLMFVKKNFLKNQSCSLKILEYFNGKNLVNLVQVKLFLKKKTARIQL